MYNRQNNDMSNRVLAHVPVFTVTGTSVLLPNNAIFSITLILICGVKIQFKVNSVSLLSKSWF